MLRGVLILCGIAVLGGCQTRTAAADESAPKLASVGLSAALLPTPLPAAPPGAGSLGAASAALPAACAKDMVFVEGAYCQTPVHRCLRWLETRGRFGRSRCAEYEQPASCAAKTRRPMSFCIDRDEYVAPDSTVPLTGRTMIQAERICKDAGKRLCLESEWTFACEGEAMSPYPYGFHRDSEACNADKNPVVGSDDSLVSLAVAPGSYARCQSPFGVRDMTGNVEEWVRSETRPKRGVMKGAYWLPTKNHCRAGQRIHGPLYSGIELGFRCCASAAR